MCLPDNICSWFWHWTCVDFSFLTLIRVNRPGSMRQRGGILAFLTIVIRAHTFNVSPSGCKRIRCKVRIRQTFLPRNCLFLERKEIRLRLSSRVNYYLCRYINGPLQIICYLHTYTFVRYEGLVFRAFDETNCQHFGAFRYVSFKQNLWRTIRYQGASLRVKQVSVIYTCIFI